MGLFDVVYYYFTHGEINNQRRTSFIIYGNIFTQRGSAGSRF